MKDTHRNTQNAALNVDLFEISFVCCIVWKVLTRSKPGSRAAISQNFNISTPKLYQSTFFMILNYYIFPIGFVLARFYYIRMISNKYHIVYIVLVYLKSIPLCLFTFRRLVCAIPNFFNTYILDPKAISNLEIGETPYE